MFVFVYTECVHSSSYFIWITTSTGFKMEENMFCTSACRYININDLTNLAWNELVEGADGDATPRHMYAACYISSPWNRLFWFVYYWHVQFPAFNKKWKKIYVECQISKDKPLFDELTRKELGA